MTHDDVRQLRMPEDLVNDDHVVLHLVRVATVARNPADRAAADDVPNETERVRDANVNLAHVVRVAKVLQLRRLIVPRRTAIDRTIQRSEFSNNKRQLSFCFSKCTTEKKNEKRKNEKERKKFRTKSFRCQEQVSK